MLVCRAQQSPLCHARSAQRRERPEKSGSAQRAAGFLAEPRPAGENPGWRRWRFARRTRWRPSRATCTCCRATRRCIARCSSCSTKRKRVNAPSRPPIRGPAANANPPDRSQGRRRRGSEGSKCDRRCRHLQYAREYGDARRQRRGHARARTSCAANGWWSISPAACRKWTGAGSTASSKRGREALPIRGAARPTKTLARRKMPARRKAARRRKDDVAGRDVPPPSAQAAGEPQTHRVGTCRTRAPARQGSARVSGLTRRVGPFQSAV